MICDYFISSGIKSSVHFKHHIVQYICFVGVSESSSIDSESSFSVLVLVRKSFGPPNPITAFDMSINKHTFGRTLFKKQKGSLFMHSYCISFQISFLKSAP